MALIINNFWEDIWAARNNPPSKSSIDEYMDDYDKCIPDEIRDKMKIPDIDTIADCILGTNNSSPGPDGIHFCFLRLFAHELAPLIRGIICDPATGNIPPIGFNFGRLFLFPKNNSQEIKDTRPITISDSINRIIAKILKDILT